MCKGTQLLHSHTPELLYTCYQLTCITWYLSGEAVENGARWARIFGVKAQMPRRQHAVNPSEL